MWWYYWTNCLHAWQQQQSNPWKATKMTGNCGHGWKSTTSYKFMEFGIRRVTVCSWGHRRKSKVSLLLTMIPQLMAIQDVHKPHN